MKKSKIFILLLNLSLKDRKDFLLFLESPIHNKKEILTTLYRSILGEIETPQTDISEEEFIEKYFSGQEFNLRKLRQLKTALTRLFYNFIEFTGFQKDKDLRNLIAVKQLRELGSNNEAFDLINKVLKEKELSVTSEDYYLNYRIFSELAQLKINFGKRYKKDILIEIAQSLDLSYLLKKLEIECAFQNAKKITGSEFQSFIYDLSPLLDQSEKRGEIKNPLFQKYKALLSLIQKGHEGDHMEDIRQFVKSTISEITAFNTTVQSDLLQYCLNFLARNIRLKDEAEDHELAYQILSKILEDSGTLSPWNLKNMIYSACKTERFNSSIEILETVLEKLDKDEFENAKNYNFGVIYFYKKELDSASETFFNLTRKRGIDEFYFADSRVYLLRILYLQGKDDDIESLLDSFRIYLGRVEKDNRIGKSHIKKYSLFLRCFSALHKTPYYDKESLLKSKLELEKSPIALDWLLEQIEIKLKK